MPYKDAERRRAYQREYQRTYRRKHPRSGGGPWSREKAEEVFAASGQPRPLCECGCGEPTEIARQTRSERGQIAGEPVRFINTHHVRLIEAELRFEEDPATHCWVWMGSRTAGGYGQVGINGSRLYAHRVFYEMLVAPIPEGLEIDHLCRNRACVNPGHMEPVTSAENSRRSPLIGRMPGSRGNRGKGKKEVAA